MRAHTHTVDTMLEQTSFVQSAGYCMMSVNSSNLLCKLQHIVDGRETLCDGMDLYAGSAVESLTNYHHLLQNLQQSVKNNVRSHTIALYGLSYLSFLHF